MPTEQTGNGLTISRSDQGGGGATDMPLMPEAIAKDGLVQWPRGKKRG